MSSHSLPVLLTTEAQDDFEDIRLYTRQKWGERQEAIYGAALLQALTSIGDNPGLGRRHDESGKEFRSYVVRQHVIYYRVTEGAVTVLRILHGRANARRALPGES
jgi:plasmid stabilization system protein ParE